MLESWPVTWRSAALTRIAEDVEDQHDDDACRVSLTATRG
jgi:hypothetical protein